MDIAYAGASAVEIIRRVRLSSELELIQTGEVDTSRFATARGAMSHVNFLACGLSQPPSPTHKVTIRVPTAAGRKRIPEVQCLTFPKHLPSGSLLQLTHHANNSSSPGNPRSWSPTVSEWFDDNRVFLDSVPLAITAIAAKYQRLINAGKLTHSEAVIRLVELIMEFAGHYGRDPVDPANGPIVENLSPSISVSGLLSQLQMMHYVQGARDLQPRPQNSPATARAPLWKRASG